MKYKIPQRKFQGRTFIDSGENQMLQILLMLQMLL